MILASIAIHLLLHSAAAVQDPPAVEIWAASWKPMRGNLSFISPMIWVDGYFKPGQDNTSINPEPLARQSQLLPPGRRAVLWYRYFLSLWGATADARPLPDGSRAATPWPSSTSRAVVAEWGRFLDLYKYCGGEMDYLIGDCEDWTRFLSWGLSESQLNAIVSDPRFGKASFGIESLQAMTSEVPIGEVLKPQSSDAYLRWNLQVGRFAAAVMNDTIWRPALDRFPSLRGSNYDGKRMTVAAAPDLNGHPQPSDNIVGTSPSPVCYGTVAQASTAWFIDPVDSSRLSRTGSIRLQRGAWGSFLMDVQLGRACRRGTPSEPLMPWVAPSSYPGDVRGTVGYPQDERLWAEMVRHLSLLGTSVFLWWNPSTVPVPSGPPIAIPDIELLASRFDSLLREVNQRLRGTGTRCLSVDPVSFTAKHVVSGMQRRDGTFLWRLSVAPGVAALVDPSNGARLPMPAGELGIWLETSTEQPPRWVPEQ